MIVNKMGGSGLTILTIIIGCVFRVTGSCVHVENDDMLEYACIGGHPSDLKVIPERTEKIRINGMLIPILSADVFSRFGDNLWVLSCSHCGIINIKADAFKRLVNLQHLSLDSNHLTIVRGVWFERLDSLTYLDLNYNDIDTIEDDVFENLPSLVDLRISGNRLQCLDLDAMNHLTELKRIFLGENKEFRCPNAVSRFLEDRGINFEPDPEWHKMPVDTIYVPVPSIKDFTTTPSSVYHARTYSPRRPDVNLVPPEIDPRQDVTYPPHDHTTFRLPVFPTRTPVIYPPREDVTIVSTIPYSEHEFVTDPSREYPTYPPRQDYPEHVTHSPQEPHIDSQLNPITDTPYESFTHPTAMPVTYPSRPEGPTPFVTETLTDLPREPYTHSPSEMILYPSHDPSIYPTPEPVTYTLYTYPPESMTHPPPESVTNMPDPIRNVPAHGYPLPYITSTTSVAMGSEGPWTESEYPLYPHENDFRQQPYYPSEASQSPSLATSLPERTEDSMKSNQEHASTASSTYPWVIDTSDYFLNSANAENETPKNENNIDPVTTSAINHVIQPYMPPSTIQPSSPDEFFQAPYNEPTVTIRPPYILDNYRRTEAPVATDVMPLETTTTDKPLPECPSSSSVSTVNLTTAFAMVFAVILKNIRMEGF